MGVQVKLWNLLRTRAVPERFCGGDSLRRGAISCVCTFISTKAQQSPLITIKQSPGKTSDVNKDWTCKDKDKDQAYKDQDKDKD